MQMSRLSDGQGFMLISVLIAAVIMGIVMLGFLSMGRFSAKQQLQTNTTFQISLISRNFATTLENGVAWNNTMNDAANVSSGTFSCLTNSITPCQNTLSNSLSFQADDVTGVNPGSPSTLHLFYGYSPALNGFTSEGQVCTGFVNPTAGTGNDSCPFHLALNWTAVCSGGVASCTTATLAQIQLNGSWTYNPGSSQMQVAFNPNRYNFQVVLNYPSLTAASCVAP